MKSGSASLALLLAGALLSPLPASGASVPLDIQAALFKKILHYDSVLKDSPAAEIRLLVLSADADIVRSFGKVGIAAKPVTVAKLAMEIRQASAVYFPAGLPDPAVAKLCVEHKVVSLSGVADVAERGDASVGLGVRENGKPEIVVNLGRLSAEGHSLPAGVLSLARVIR